MGTSFSPALRGNPDWQGSILAENFALLPAYGDDHLYFAMPRIARLARNIEGSPDFFLEFVSDRNSAGPDQSLYSIIKMGLTRDGDAKAAYQLLASDNPGAVLMPVTFTTGTCWHLECDDARETAPFAWENAERATIYCRVAAKTGQLLYAALGSGGMTVARAAVECEMAAFLPRIESTVTFNAANLLASLRMLNPGGSNVPFRRLITFFDNPPSGLLQFEGSDKGAMGRSRSLALAGRVRHYFGKAAPCPQIFDGPHVALCLPPEGDSPVTMWDLRTPIMTGTPLFLDFDPFTPILKNGGRERVTKFTRIPMLPNDLLTERVSVASNLPPRILNCDTIELTLYVDKAYSRSGNTAVASVTLHPDRSRTATVELKFKKIGQKPYRARITVASEDQVIEMPWFDCSGDYLYIGADRLPGTFLTVQATHDLLRQAAISMAVAGGSDEADIAATLTTDEPTASFLLLTEQETKRLAITARDPLDSDHVLVLDLPCRPVTLDLSSFHEYGPQTTTVTVQFHDGIQDAQFEFLPESDEGEPIVIGFSPSQASGQFNYFSTRIFRNRYRFRQASQTGDTEAEWSGYQWPGRDLTIAVYREGAQIVPAPNDQRRNERG
jgi:hypothetical protein